MSTAIELPKKQIPKQLENVAKWANLMDSAFTIPGTKITFGWDPIIGMFPIIGNIVDYFISGYLMLAMIRNQASGKVVAKMFVNICTDALVGAVPFLGKIFDVFYKANKRNLNLALEHFEEGKHTGSSLPILIPFILVFTLLFAGIVYVSFIVFNWLWANLMAIQI